MARSTPRVLPFAGGMVPDLPSHLVGPDRCVYAENMFAPNGVFRRRYGWDRIGTVQFAYAPATKKTALKTSSGRIVLSTFRAPPYNGETRAYDSATATNYLNLGAFTIPRAEYNGEYLLVTRLSDGTTPYWLRRYAEAPYAAPSSGSVGSIANTATINNGGTTTPVDWYARFEWRGGGRATSVAVPPPSWYRIVANSGGTLTLQDLKFSQSVSQHPFAAVLYPYGHCYPAVPVENSGTVTAVGEPTNTVTGTGTLFTRGVGTGGADSIIITPDGEDAIHASVVVLSDTSIGNYIGATVSSASVFQMASRLPFMDVAVYNGSLFGCGVPGQPGRVYIGPDGWNLSMPPGLTTPYDPVRNNRSSNVNDFLMDFIDCPSIDSKDAVVSLLETPGGVLVLCRKTVRIITGSYPSFSQDIVEQGKGVGAYSVESSISGVAGAFWVDENGIYWSLTGGDISNIAELGIAEEWKNLMRSGVSYISLGVHGNHLLVAVKPTTGSGWSYIFNLRERTWGSRFLNYVPYYQHPFRSDDTSGIDMLLAASPSHGYPIDAAPMLAGTKSDGSAAAGANDYDGTVIGAKVTSGSGLAQSAGIEGEAKLLEVSLAMRLPDASGAAHVDASVEHVDSLHDGVPAKTKQVTFPSAASSEILRKKKPVNRAGRQVQVALELDSPATATDFEIHEFVTTWRDLRGRT